MPFRILQEEQQEVDLPKWSNQTTINKLYDEKNQKKETVPQVPELPKSTKQLEELEVIAVELMAVDTTTAVPLTLPSL